MNLQSESSEPSDCGILSIARRSSAFSSCLFPRSGLILTPHPRMVTLALFFLVTLLSSSAALASTRMLSRRRRVHHSHLSTIHLPCRQVESQRGWFRNPSSLPPPSSPSLSLFLSSRCFYYFELTVIIFELSPFNSIARHPFCLTRKRRRATVRSSRGRIGSSSTRTSLGRCPGRQQGGDDDDQGTQEDQITQTKNQKKQGVRKLDKTKGRKSGKGIMQLQVACLYIYIVGDIYAI